jgi:hypothetical protein
MNAEQFSQKVSLAKQELHEKVDTWLEDQVDGAAMAVIPQLVVEVSSLTDELGASFDVIRGILEEKGFVVDGGRGNAISGSGRVVIKWSHT